MRPSSPLSNRRMRRTAFRPNNHLTIALLLFLPMMTCSVQAFVANPQHTRHGATTLTIRASTNEWGIPHPDDLPVLSHTIVSKLPNGGRISLIGAGPGDPDLLTLKAARLLQEPDAVVVADRLVAPEILQLIRTTELHVARKLPGCADLAQDEIYQWCHAGLAAGKHVIRLKIGDPYVFGRGGEEVLQFRKYGVEAEVVPVRSEKLLMD